MDNIIKSNLCSISGCYNWGDCIVIKLKLVLDTFNELDEYLLNNGNDTVRTIYLGICGVVGYSLLKKVAKETILSKMKGRD